jgi:Transglutaminase-like superfamily
VPGFRLIPDSDLNTPQLDELRNRARALAAAGDWAGLLALRADLEQDSRYWPDMWGPMCAIAARQARDPGAIGLLDDLVQAGFRQPQRLNGQLESAFAGDPGWPRLRDSMRRRAPAPPLLLTEWPEIAPAAPLGLVELPHRAAELRALAPAPLASAWPTAVTVLDWVSHRWQAAKAHMEIDDAVECLRRVDEGEQFACMEYSLVLAQALNALGIPARRLSLRQQDYHVGIGRCHVVCEAWIDDFCRWVILDGQNGLYWAGDDGEPLGSLELQRAGQLGQPRPGYVTVRDDVADGDADRWFAFFGGTASSTAGTWAPASFGVVFQRTRLAPSGRLERRAEALYPDLSQLSVQTAADGDRPALRLASAHPHARGFAADGHPLPCDLLPLDGGPGQHELMLAARTGYATLPGQPLRYLARSLSPRGLLLGPRPDQGVADVQQQAGWGGHPGGDRARVRAAPGGGAGR